MKIPKHLYHYFEEVGTVLHYHPDDIIYLQEDRATQLYVVIQGRVRVFLLSNDGQEITLDILRTGSIFGESSIVQNSPRPVSVNAINEVTSISCKLDDLYPSMAKSKELMFIILRLISQTCDYLTYLVKRAYFYDRYEKIASFLVEQSEKINNLRTPLPFTHSEIACITGLNRVTVTRVLNEFSKKRLIDLSYRELYVRDIEGLKDIYRNKNN